ncbi:MAG: hypothetical protein RL638_770 [Bacteroidota bacterium]|jgi:hypothetical protein
MGIKYVKNLKIIPNEKAKNHLPFRVRPKRIDV